MSDKKLHEIRIKEFTYSISLYFDRENKISFSVKPYFSTETDSGKNTNLWKYEIDTLRKLTDDVFDIIAFHDSLIKNGEHCIFTCGCGVPDCAGFEPCTQVESDGIQAVWIIKNRYFKDDLKIVISEKICKEVLESTIRELKTISRLYPSITHGGHTIEELIKIMENNQPYYEQLYKLYSKNRK